jgi:hypothetical protein
MAHFEMLREKMREVQVLHLDRIESGVRVLGWCHESQRRGDVPRPRKDLFY